MRPKKILLYVSANEVNTSTMRFMLETNGYRVLTAAREEEAIDAFTFEEIALVLVEFSIPKINGVQLIDRLKVISPHIPMILIADQKRLAGERGYANAVLPPTVSAAEWLDRIKVMAAKRRGLHKGIPSPWKGIPNDQRQVATA